LGDALNSWGLLLPGGFILFHDYECVEETTCAVHEFLKQTGACLVETVSGVAVACKSGEGTSSGDNDAEERLSTVDARVHPLQVEIEHLTQLLNASEDERRSQRKGVSWRPAGRL
jgi:hypothetical protein